MIPFIRKQTLVTLRSPMTWWALGLYWMILAFFKFHFLQDEGFTMIANLLFAFLLTNVLISITETEDTKVDMLTTSASLPSTRTHIVLADYTWCLAITSFSLAYTFLAGLTLFPHLPKNLFVDLYPLSLPEASFVLIIMAWTAAIHTPITFRFGSYSKTPAVLIFAILATLFCSFWLLPTLIITLQRVEIAWLFHQKWGAFGPLLMAVESMRHPSSAVMIVLVSLAAVGISIGVSIRIFRKKDL